MAERKISILEEWTPGDRVDNDFAKFFRDRHDGKITVEINDLLKKYVPELGCALKDMAFDAICALLERSEKDIKIVIGVFCISKVFSFKIEDKQENIDEELESGK